LAALVTGAEPLLQVYISDVLDRFDTTKVEGKLAAVDELAPKLAAVPDPLARDLYCRDVAETLRLDETRMRERLRAAKHPRGRSDVAGKEGAPRATDPVEKAMLECLVYEPEHRGAFLSDGIDGWMNPGVLQEAARFVARRTEGPDALPLEDAPALARARLAAVLVQDERPHTAYSVLESTLRLRSLKARQSQIERDLRLAEARGDQHQVSELLREQGDIGEALLACQGALRKKSP
jgi:DNA primase